MSRQEEDGVDVPSQQSPPPPESPMLGRKLRFSASVKRGDANGGGIDIDARDAAPDTADHIPADADGGGQRPGLLPRQSAPPQAAASAPAPAASERRNLMGAASTLASASMRSLMGRSQRDGPDQSGRSLAVTWDVKLSSVRRSVVGGRMVPTVGAVPGVGRRRKVRIRIEVVASGGGTARGSGTGGRLEGLGKSVMALGGSTPPRPKDKKLHVRGTSGTSVGSIGPATPGGASAASAAGGGAFLELDGVDGTRLADAVAGAGAESDVKVTLRVLRRVRPARPRGRRRSGDGGDDRGDGEGYDSDDTSSTTMTSSSTSGAAAGAGAVEADPITGDLYRERYRMPLDRLSLTRADLKRAKCNVTLGTGPDRRERDVVFRDSYECKEFEATVRGLEEALRVRKGECLKRALDVASEKRVATAAAAAARDGKRGGPSSPGKAGVDADAEVDGGKAVAVASPRRVEAHDPANLLIEIVSATDLRDADVGGKSDPYAEIRVGHRVLHRTDHIDDDLNPIWTLSTNNLCLVTLSLEEFFALGSAVTFEVKDYDALGRNESLGQATVPQTALLEMDGERVELPLQQIKTTNKDQGTLVIRCRAATESDLKFMEMMRAEKSMLKRRQGVAGQSKYISPIVPPTKFSAIRRLKKEVEVEQPRGNGEHAAADGVVAATEKLYRVRPYPDPDVPGDKAKKWMSKTDIERTTYELSRTWIKAGVGTHSNAAGRLYVEILGCDNLPNMDSGPNKNDKTDAFVMVVFEDAIVSTDVVSDCLSPRFLPWTRRAVKFEVSHPTSPLLLGVYDWDNYPLNNHDAIGRVAVSLDSLRPNTEYVLTYKLFDTAVWPKREENGSITVRLVLEWNDTHELFKESIKAPPKFYVNVQERKNFCAAYATVEGQKDVHTYSLETMTEQGNELYEIFNVVFDIYDAIMFIVLWKGHVRVRWWGREILLPLHSMVAFVFGVLLVERPWLAPAILTASVGWAMLALLERRLARPSPWARPPSYWDMLRTFATGGEIAPQAIEPDEDGEADREYLERTTKKRSEMQAHVQKLYDEKMKEWEEMAEMMGEGGDLDDLTTRSEKKLNPVPFRSLLYPYQVWFGQLCHTKRFVGYVLSWEHYFLSFWITTASLALGFVFLFVPWRFLCLWTGRLFVWLVLGPWTSYFLRKRDSKKEQRRRERERLRQKDEAFRETMQQLQIQKEHAVKLKSMKKHVFGHFIVSMPHFYKLDRYRDEPLPSSTATPIPRGESMETRLEGAKKNTLLGQRLHGEMIPENVNDHFALSETLEEEVTKKVTSATRRLGFLAGKKDE